MDIKQTVSDVVEKVEEAVGLKPEEKPVETPIENVQSEKGSEQKRVFDPKEVDPDIDVSEMPVGTQILAKGVNYTLNQDKMLQI